MGISVLGPDVNESGENFTPVETIDDKLGSIRFGLSAVKGVGDVAGRLSWRKEREWRVCKFY